LDASSYRKRFPPSRRVNVGTEDEPFVFVVDSMSVFGLMRLVWNRAEKKSKKGAVIRQDQIGRIVTTEGDAIFADWAPEAILSPRIFRSMSSAADEGHDIDVPDDLRDFLLPSDVLPTHVFRLLTALLEDGGGGASASGFREVGRGGQSGTHVEGIRDSSP